jgi:hypothetical protein
LGGEGVGYSLFLGSVIVASDVSLFGKGVKGFN